MIRLIRLACAKLSLPPRTRHRCRSCLATALSISTSGKCSGRAARSLSPKAYQLLALLVEARPKPLSKPTLHDTLWPDTFVVEANLSNLVGEIRAALGDSAREARIIRTLHGFGYAFTGDARTGEHEATATPPPPNCWLMKEWERFALAAGENIIGRAEDASIRLDAAGVSRRHARIVVSGGGATIEDLGSENGTALRGERVTTPRMLVDGDDVSVGAIRLLFRQQSSTVATTATVTANPARPEPTQSSGET